MPPPRPGRTTSATPNATATTVPVSPPTPSPTPTWNNAQSAAVGAVERYEEVTAEIAAVKKAVGKKLLKVIIEACYLEDEEKIAMCRAVTEGGADYIKTSTGFGPGGATHPDVQLMKQHIGLNVKIKAAGGIRTIADMKQYLSEGCDRIGASAAVKLLKDKPDSEI